MWSMTLLTFGRVWRGCRRGRKNGDLDAGGGAFGAIDALRGLLEVAVLGFENIGHKFLGVAIVEGKPGALNLHHDAMALFEDVVRGVEVDGEGRDFVRSDWLVFFERVAEAPAEDFVG